MRFSEILNLVRLNLIQNKFKMLLTSIGIIVGAATIVIVIAVGRGGKAEAAEQFRNLNAGAIDISYEQAQGASGFSFGSGSGASSFGGSGSRPDSGGFSGFGGGMPSFSGSSGSKPSELSGGQRQRAAIARALCSKPTLLLADEPTGALDQGSGAEVLRLFTKLHEMGHTIVMITHDLNAAKWAQRTVRIVDGELFEDAG